uniref:TldD/PmbA family protein n=1 Tax=Ignisphaera aggregans TaxID=334771 RepID=A0A7C2ZRB4_9CREN
MIDVERIVEKGIKTAEGLGASEAEIHVVENSSVSIVATRRGIESVGRRSLLTVDVRVSLGKRVTVQGAVVSSEKDVLDLIERAVSIVKVVPEDPNWVSLPRNCGYTPTSGIVDNKVKNMDTEYYKSLIVDVLQKPGHIDKRAFASEVSVEAGTLRRWIGNSYTSSAMTYEKTSFFFGVAVKAVEEGYEGSYHSFYLAPTLKEFDPDHLVEKSTTLAVASLRAKPIDTGRYTVVLAPRVLAAVLRALLVPAIRADQVQKNRSPLAKKLFDKIFAESITIVDDGAAPNMIGSAPFDDEGIPTKRKTVVDKGALLTYLYDTYTAYIDNQESTGNAFRAGLGVPPAPNASNMIVIPGTDPLETIIRDVKDVIVVHATIGEWLSNPVNGNLGATITNAIYYKNGESVQAVKGVALSGNIYSMLAEDLVTLSREVELVGNMLVPSVCIRNVSIAGR